MRVVAIIPARGGSRGLPGKNLMPISGRPLVQRSVDAALASRLVDDVFVSSDDVAILDAGRGAGAGVITRPDDLSGDSATTESALVHALSTLADQGQAPYDILVLLQCTSPFTKAEDIDAVVSAIAEDGFDTALSVTPSHSFLWRIHREGSGAGVNHDHTRQRKRRQDMEPEYRENGAIYAMRAAEFMVRRNRFFGRTKPVCLSMPEIEIDDRQDFEIAELMAARAAAGILSQGAPTPAALRSVAVLVTDFDGVHTDDAVFVTENGDETVRCSRSDGMGIERLRWHGHLQLLILSKETNRVVARRAAKLKMDVIHGVDDKVEVLDRWLQEQGHGWDAVAYIGNDSNDVECLRRASLGVAPADAHPEALRSADWVLTRRGGDGAIREFSDYYLAAGL